MSGAAAGTGRVEAAGCVVHRHRGRLLEVLLVHRPERRDKGRSADWSWPKGKLEEGERAAVAAVRETAEETGLAVRLGPRLGSLRYPLADSRRKRVRYWAATALDAGAGFVLPPAEVDDAAWLDVDEAARRLTHGQDLEPLAALRAQLAESPRGTWPLVVLRHGRAHPRAGWSGPDAQRPLAVAGLAQAELLRPLLSCWAPERVLSSPWSRCTQSVQPFAAGAGVRLGTDPALSEAGHEQSPEVTRALVAGLLGAGRAVVLCSHRPVLPTLLDALAARAGSAVAQRLRKIALHPGEAAVAHVAGVGGSVRVVAMEHHSA
ncbi:NUDIX hydrolase [Kineococcus glutinatus]|uniref:NUDIX hydrolase n=1 Tax=Kineococcus glutinatus TaxID=1070872 RepID=A0ABP9HQK5_9ACTN